MKIELNFRCFSTVIVHGLLFAVHGMTQGATVSIASVSPSSLIVGSTTTITVTGTGFTAAMQVLIDGKAATTTYVSATQLKASVPVAASVGGVNAVVVSNGFLASPPVLVPAEPVMPQVYYGAAARFLEQAAFGPDPRSIARVQQIGFDGFLNEQFDLKTTVYPPSSDTSTSLTSLQGQFFVNIISGQDQVRQRVAFALGQLFVVSGSKTYSPQQLSPYLQLLHDNAFGNYLTLLRAVTLSPTMGRYLDMANNVRTNQYSSTVPNENYARELLQLFTTGTDQLNIDGSLQRTLDGKSIPLYSRQTITGFSQALTGWTYAPLDGAVSQMPNPANFSASMVAFDGSHEPASKTLLNGFVLPPNQTASQDINDVLNNVFTHPNAGPFLARFLIHQLVTSNPTPAYVQRVAQIFNSDSQGVRGNLRAVVRAVLLDNEARAADPPNMPSSGLHLREPVLYIASMIRAFGGSVAPTNLLSGYSSLLGQNPFYPDSVLGYYSTTYAIPTTSFTAPEFQIFDPSSAVTRANLAYTIALGPSSLGVTLDSGKLDCLGGDPDAILERLSRACLRGQMTDAMKRVIRPAILAWPASLRTLRAGVAVYLVASSPYFEVHR